jgi:hypothetical protein
MRATAVHELLKEVGLPDLMTPNGFLIHPHFRLECAGGIAGRTDMWRIVKINTTLDKIESKRVMFDGWHRYKYTLKPALLAFKAELLKAAGEGDQ